ncbi:Uncharacterized protein TPAR_02357 [Tolypocladium paradoxum]|uniref:Uncharacterized protein n=1 Tax=Tolypocladium paradoxum TaxID=94208 RepID=A0A2S4L4V2_9HYPO|nr:Uncharacterized protein TPAR_02357 [Tolypocladium paradoxum]
MRSTSTLTLLAILSSQVSARPWNDVIAGRSRELAEEIETTASPVVARDVVCQPLDNHLIQIDNSREVVAYWSFGGQFARSVCNTHGWADCTGLAGAMSSAVMSIFAITKFKAEGAVGLPTRDIGSLIGSLTEHLAASYAEAGIGFTSVDDATPALHSRYASNEKKPVEVASVTGLQFGNGTHDLHVFDFDDGNGHVYVPLPNNGSRHRRGISHDGPGFKVSYTTRKPSTLSYSQQVTMADVLGAYWSNTAANMDLHDLIGFVATNHDANFYWRIIPEMYGFGLNYESVDICGQMGQFL